MVCLYIEIHLYADVQIHICFICIGAYRYNMHTDNIFIRIMQVTNQCGIFVLCKQVALTTTHHRSCSYRHFNQLRVKVWGV